MSTITKQILEQHKKQQQITFYLSSRKSPCPSGGRARDLVESLLASLDQPDARIDELWAKEAENRLAAFEAGQTKAYPADKVFQEFADL